ncbi:MAG: hypothetical protein V1818_04735 [Candidatus Aenigmatarchaeota archaeon]
MVKKDPIKSIIEALRMNPEGLTLLSLASVTGLHRHTCTKYINELLKADVVYQRDVGVAKLCYLKKKVENNAEEDRLVASLKKKRRGKTQLKLMVAVVILTFLLSETAIIAYANNTILNMTNTSNINTSPMTSTSNVSDLTAFFNETSDLNETGNITVEPPSVPNLTDSVGTVDYTNYSSESQNNGENTTFNATFLTENVTISNQTDDMNTTENQTNATDLGASNASDNQNQTIDIENLLNGTSIGTVDPTFDVQLVYPQRITRGELIGIRAEASTDTFAKNVYLKWLLPKGFEIVSGNAIEACDDMNASSCISEIEVRTDLTDIGLNDIRVVMEYEK